MNFDKEIRRKGTDSIKYDLLKARFGRSDLIPLWVADMDFRTPKPVVRALRRRFRHEIYGYSCVPESYWRAIVDWEKKIHSWTITRNDLTFIPGIVRGIGFAIDCFTSPGDAIVVQPPVYMPFINLPKQTGRRLIYNKLVFADGSYQMNLKELETICREQYPKMLILSNPHNPAGITWSAEVLSSVADICTRYGVTVISDEIHADMALPGNVHIPFAKASAKGAECSITFAAPTKTFNIAGLVSSFAVVKNPELRQKFYSYLEVRELNSPTFIAVEATEAAFTKCCKWRLKMLDYVNSNVNYIREYFALNIPEIKVIVPQASFLVWLDCSRLMTGEGRSMTQSELVSLFVDKARLALNDGVAFGPGGEGHMRLNVGCPRSTLELAMKRLNEAVASIRNR